VAGPRDAKISLGRALAAHKLLVNNGVVAEKINVFSQEGGRLLLQTLRRAEHLTAVSKLNFLGNVNQH
jgi:hypothetical protein